MSRPPALLGKKLPPPPTGRPSSRPPSSVSENPPVPSGPQKLTPPPSKSSRPAPPSLANRPSGPTESQPVAKNPPNAEVRWVSTGLAQPRPSVPASQTQPRPQPPAKQPPSVPPRVLPAPTSDDKYDSMESSSSAGGDSPHELVTSATQPPKSPHPAAHEQARDTKQPTTPPQQVPTESSQPAVAQTQPSAVPIEPQEPPVTSQQQQATQAQQPSAAWPPQVPSTAEPRSSATRSERPAQQQISGAEEQNPQTPPAQAQPPAPQQTQPPPQPQQTQPPPQPQHTQPPPQPQQTQPAQALAQPQQTQPSAPQQTQLPSEIQHAAAPNPLPPPTAADTAPLSATRFQVRSDSLLSPSSKPQCSSAATGGLGTQPPVRLFPSPSRGARLESGLPPTQRFAFSPRHQDPQDTCVVIDMGAVAEGADLRPSSSGWPSVYTPLFSPARQRVVLHNHAFQEGCAFQASLLSPARTSSVRQRSPREENILYRPPAHNLFQLLTTQPNEPEYMGGPTASRAKDAALSYLYEAAQRDQYNASCVLMH